MSTGKQYVAKDDIESLIRKIVRRVVGSGYATGSGRSGASAFIGLTDAPHTYSGEALKLLRANAGEDALEFFEPLLSDLGDVDLGSPFTPQDGDVLIYDGSSGLWRPGPQAPAGSGAPGSGSGASYLSDLLDVLIPSGEPTIGDHLVYESGGWTPEAPGAGGGFTIYDYLVQGRWYGPQITNGATGTQAFLANWIYAFPYAVTKTHSYDRIGVNVTAGYGPAKKMRLGVYANAAGDYAYPGDLIVDGGELTVNSSADFISNISITLDPGLYWVSFLGDEAYTMRSVQATGQYYVLGITTPLTNAGSPYFYKSQAYGALPDPFPASASFGAAGNIPILALRVA